MTPEEKLLALIQQDKRQADNAAKPVASVQPVAPVQAPAPPPAAPRPVVSVPASPVTATQAARKEQAVTPEVKPAVVTEPVVAPKLKLAETSVAKPVEPQVTSQESRSKIQSTEAKKQTPATPVPASKPVPSVPQMPVPPPAPEVVIREAVSTPVVSATIPFTGATSSSGLSLTLLNRALGLVVLVLTVLVFWRIGAIQPGIAAAIDRQVQGAGSMTMPPLSITEEANPLLDAYLEKVGSRNLFVPVATTAKGGVAAAPAESAGAIKDLKLMAISLDSSDASESTAIIKNKADSKTYFVKPGQTVGSTDYVLDRVTSDRAILKLRKQEFELK